MPIIEFVCPFGHLTERILSFAEAEHMTAHECQKCFDDDPDSLILAPRVLSVPAPAHLYGRPEGYNKPSALKRHSYKKITPQGNN